MHSTRTARSPSPNASAWRVGATVRGFNERAVATDRGYVVNLEGYTPDMAGSLGVPGTLKFLAFIDSAQGSNVGPSVKFAIASAGVGLRYNLNKDISARFDVAQVFDGYTPKNLPNESWQAEGSYRRPRRSGFRFLMPRLPDAGKFPSSVTYCMAGDGF